MTIDLASISRTKLFIIDVYLIPRNDHKQQLADYTSLADTNSKGWWA